ncbi:MULTISPECIES: hypothetical protein [Actinosynnema]|uniref:hypothetical protein n=1 Tax=Actinosynnema TaxID=40566 RepID=UPI00019AB161|nr:MULTISPECIES: hypothetical protein [Actinosynnema]
MDDETGDLVLQGAQVTDQDALAELTAKSPRAPHETVVRIPARMRDLVQEACRDRATDVR